MTVIPLGRALPRASSHLPADSVGHVVVCLFGVAPRRDCPFHPVAPIDVPTARKPRWALERNRLVSVALILASRRTGVTRYAARWSPDFPLRNRRWRSDRLACFTRPFYVSPGGTGREACGRGPRKCTGSS